MKLAETVIIKLFSWTVIPSMLFIISWWGLALIPILNIYEISDKLIAFFAISGMFIGFIISIFTHKYLFFNFYKIDYFYLSLFYIFFSAVGIAFLMGIPILVILIGVIAGIYIGRRLYITNSYDEKIVKSVSIFSSLVTGFWVLFICLIIKNDVALNQEYTGISIDIFSGTFGMLIVVLIVLLFILLQYFLTNVSCKLAYKMGS